MKGIRLLYVVVMCAGVVCAVLALSSMLESYRELYVTATEGLKPQGVPLSLWPHALMLAAGRLVGELAGFLLGKQLKS